MACAKALRWEHLQQRGQRGWLRGTRRRELGVGQPSCGALWATAGTMTGVSPHNCVRGATHVRTTGTRGIPETERRSKALSARSLPPPARGPAATEATSFFQPI